MTEYAKRDQKIHQLRCELNHRKELLAGKTGKLSEATKSNSMLESILNDFISSSRNHESFDMNIFASCL